MRLDKKDIAKMKKEIMLLSAMVLALAATPAMAGGFVRGEIGRSDANFDVDGVGDDSDDDTSYSIRGGYFFNNNFAVEGFYSSFYDKSFEFDDGAGGTIDADLKLSGIGLGVVGKTDFGADQAGFFLMGRAGFMHGKVDASATGFGSGNASSNKPYFGVGLGYDFSPTLGLSLNWDRYEGSGDDLDITANTLALGLEARF
jgi:OOP family OmpA-OmpF porin